MWEQMVLATGYQASLVTLPANEASTWLAQQLGGVIKMDSGPVRNPDVMVSLHKIELILCKPELKKSNQTKVRILILDPFKSSAWKFLDTFTKAFENNHISATETNNKGVMMNISGFFSCYLSNVIITDQWCILGM